MRAPLLAALLGLTAAAPAPDPTGQRWWSHIAEIASDKYEGRLTGTPGYERAAAYVAGRFGALGLKPAGTNGYLQRVRFVEQTVDQSASRLTLSGAGGTRPLAIGDQALLGSRFTQPRRSMLRSSSSATASRCAMSRTISRASISRARLSSI